MNKRERETLPDLISWTTEEITSQIDAVVEKQAVQMVGGTAGKETLDRAKEIARSIIMDAIEQAIVQQTRLLKERAAMVEDYNGFCQQEMREPDFEAVQQFAVCEYFNAQPITTQRAIQEAYMRVESNNATAADTELVKRYFTDAKKAYHKKTRRGNAIER